MGDENSFLDIKDEQKLDFYGGKIFSFLPFIVFLIVAISISVMKAPDTKGMWVGAVLGIMIAFFFAKDKDKYSQTIIDGMASPTAIVPVAAWIFAGLFGHLLQSTQLVDGIIWAAYNIGLQGRLFVIVSFLASTLFATAAGTGFGTIIAGISVLYPAGVLLGAKPVVLAGAIVGGGAFGDNLAPLSDTTICSAASQNTDIGGVVRSRFKYSSLAGIITIIILALFGGGGSTAHEIPQNLLDQYMEPKGLLMIIPALLVIYLALKEWHLISAITIGSTLAIVEALALNLITFNQLFTIQDGSVTGILVDGIGGMVAIAILAMLIMSTVRIMVTGGGIELLLEGAKKIVNSVTAVEVSIGALITGVTAVMGINAPPILAVGSAYAKPLGEKYELHPYRRANILDGLACTLVYSLPWTPALLLVQSLVKEASAKFGAEHIPTLSTMEIFPWITYCWVMFIVMFVAIFSGWGREYIGPDGEPIKTPPSEIST
ncbi:Na+/H+ antiporter NhaC family protein [Halanaerobaculum tunisiense]